MHAGAQISSVIIFKMSTNRHVCLDILPCFARQPTDEQCPYQWLDMVMNEYLNNIIIFWIEQQFDEQVQRDPIF
jgi:hypothetical protein